VLDFPGLDAAGGPEHAKIIEQIRAFENDTVPPSPHGVEADLDSRLGQLFRHFGNAVLKQLRGPRNRRITTTRRQHRRIKPVD